MSDSSSKKRKRDKKKNRHKHSKDDSSDPSSSDDCDSSDNSDYKRKKRKRKSDQKKYPIKGGEDIQYISKESIRNILNANIDVHSRRLIAEFPAYGIKRTEKFQSNCANITFAEKVDMTGFFSKSHIKEGDMQ